MTTQKFKDLSKGFSSIADQYDDLYYGQGPMMWLMTTRCRQALTEIDPGTDEVILEVGPGSGAYTAETIKKGAKVITIDISARMLTVCKKRFDDKAKFLMGSILDLPIKSNSFDKAFTMGVMTHLPQKDLYVKATKELLRTVKKGGTICFDIPRYHILKILYTKVYLRFKSLRLSWSEETKKISNHLFTRNDLRKLEEKIKLTYPNISISVKKFGWGIFYLVKIRKNH